MRLTTNDILDVSTIDISHFGSLNDPLGSRGGHRGEISDTLISVHQLPTSNQYLELTLFTRFGTFRNKGQDPKSPIIRPQAVFDHIRCIPKHDSQVSREVLVISQVSLLVLKDSLHLAERQLDLVSRSLLQKPRRLVLSCTH
jgi:hypothetical protein